MTKQTRDKKNRLTAAEIEQLDNWIRSNLPTVLKCPRIATAQVLTHHLGFSVTAWNIEGRLTAMGMINHINPAAVAPNTPPAADTAEQPLFVVKPDETSKALLEKAVSLQSDLLATTGLVQIMALLRDTPARIDRIERMLMRICEAHKIPTD